MFENPCHIYSLSDVLEWLSKFDSFENKGGSFTISKYKNKILNRPNNMKNLKFVGRLILESFQNTFTFKTCLLGFHWMEYTVTETF